MSKLLVTGGKSLRGKVSVSGSKNAALALIPATILADSPTTLTNVPVIRDVAVMAEIIMDLGGKVEGVGTNTLVVDPAGIKKYELNPILSGKVRASVVFAAPLLAKFGKALITPPGGDQIGERLLDTHFALMQEMGVKIRTQDGKYFLKWEKKKDTNIFLEEASVTATEMGLILASATNKTTKIEDAACEPHVRDLASLLIKMGSKIKGAGTNRLVISGKEKLSGCEHGVVYDHIDGATFAIAAAITNGNIEISGCPKEDYHMILSYLRNMGVEISHKENSLYVKPSKLIPLKRKFQTRPWPGFPTDLMSPFIVLATQAQGTVLCHDWMYEWRIFFVDDLISMGANIFIADPHRVIVTGQVKLHSENLFCKDIRAGMSLVLAALVAEGTSEIDNIETVERGYEKIEERFKLLGAAVKRV